MIAEVSEFMQGSSSAYTEVILDAYSDDESLQNDLNIATPLKRQKSLDGLDPSKLPPDVFVKKTTQNTTTNRNNIPFFPT